MFEITDQMLSADELVDQIVEQKKAHILHGALTGENEFYEPETLPELDKHSIRLLTGALGHLEHLSYLEGQVINEGHVTDFDHDYFKAWKLAGTPGISKVILVLIKNK